MASEDPGRVRDSAVMPLIASLRIMRSPRPGWPDSHAANLRTRTSPTELSQQGSCLQTCVESISSRIHRRIFRVESTCHNRAEGVIYTTLSHSLLSLSPSRDREMDRKREREERKREVGRELSFSVEKPFAFVSFARWSMFFKEAEEKQKQRRKRRDEEGKTKTEKSDKKVHRRVAG